MPLLLTLTSCKKQTDYSAYISERRTNIFLYGDDNFTLKLYLSDREVPYVANGYMGELSPLVECFATFTKTPKTVTLACDDVQGEMAYQTAKDVFYFSVGKATDWNKQVNFTLTYDGEKVEGTALSVLTEGLLSEEQILACVQEHSPETFTTLTKNGSFLGEIYIRLLYDGNCWYYVGITDRSQTTYAYLVDPSLGKVLATRTLQN
jgi:hypothetical protein